MRARGNGDFFPQVFVCEPEFESIMLANRASNCFIIFNIPSKDVVCSDLICILAMYGEALFDFYHNAKLSFRYNKKYVITLCFDYSIVTNLAELGNYMK